MNAQVDVLAVFDEAASWLPYDGDDNRILERFSEARAAVAELIESNLEFDAAHLTYLAAKTGKPRNDAWARVQAAIDRRHAALARVGGAA